MRLRTTLLFTVLMSASPVWAYRPLHGVYQNTGNAPVVTRSVSTSLADKEGKLDSNWDTTIVLEQKDSREVARVDVAFSLLGNQNRTITVRRVVLQRDHSWKQGEQWEYRLQQDHMGWPGETTLVQVVSVTFTNGETWDSSNKPEQKLQDFTTPDGQEKATLPENNPSSTYIPPIVLPTGGGTGSSPSGTGYVPPRPRVSPARPGFSRSVPSSQPNPTTPTPSQAQPAPIPGSSTPGSPPSSPSIGTSPNTSPPPQSNPFPGTLSPGSSIPGTNSFPANGSTPVPSTPTAPNPRGTPEDLTR